MMRYLARSILCTALALALGSSTAEAQAAQDDDIAVLIEDTNRPVRVTFHPSGVTVSYVDKRGPAARRSKRRKNAGKIVVYRPSAGIGSELRLEDIPVIGEYDAQDEDDWGIDFYHADKETGTAWHRISPGCWRRQPNKANRAGSTSPDEQ